MFIRTTAINKILALKQPTRVIPGGTSSGKTHGIIPVLIDRAARDKVKITVVNETIPAAKDGPVEIFKTIMEETGRWIESHWIRNPLEYTFGNGSKIQFKSFDSVGKAKASGKRDILRRENCHECSQRCCMCYHSDWKRDLFCGRDRDCFQVSGNVECNF